MNSSGKKTVVLGITGGIAAYKMANFSHILVKAGYDVHVIMTKNSTNFITPLTFESLTSNPVILDTFEKNGNYEIQHIALAQKADLLFIAPATANILAKLANGIADDALSTQALACTCKKIVSPCMNTRMLHNPATLRNIETLRSDGYTIIEPFTGLLACGDIGDGKLPDDTTLFSYVERALNESDSLKGKNVLVTAGATRESLDPVRFITNHASGKMGFAMAHECMLRGANVTLVMGACTATPPAFVDIVHVSSAEDMFNAVLKIASQQDIIIKAAAVADYTPLEFSTEKIKKSGGDLSFNLKRTVDILKYLGENKTANQFLLGFSMETQNMIENSQKKLKKKNADMIAANNIKVEGAGFGGDTNVVTIITEDSVRELPKMTKEDVASAIMDEVILRISKQKESY